MKCPSPSKVSAGSEPKSQEKTMMLKEKVQLLDMLWEGKSYAAVGLHYGIKKKHQTLHIIHIYYKYYIWTFIDIFMDHVQYLQSLQML